MLDIQKYIEGEVVKREKIAMDIKYRRIGEEELRAIVEEPAIKSDFFGQGYNKKVPKDQWTERYLDKLSYAVAAECFNPEYLYYLNEVAEYVNSKKKGEIFKRIIRAVVEYAKKHKKLVLALVVIAVLIWFFTGRNK